MMGRYRRTVSFPNPISPNPTPRPNKSLHIRSASLPCTRPNPLIPQLRDHLTQLQSWDRAQTRPTQACDGLSRLKVLLDSFDDVLQLPITQDSLSSTSLVDNLLEDFLRFVDIYATFQASLLGLKQELSSAQVVLRRRDFPKLGLHLKAQKKIANEISKLAASVPSTAITADVGQEVERLVVEVHRMTASVSAWVMDSVSGWFAPGRRWGGLGLRRRREDEEGGVVEGVERLMGLLRKYKKKGEEEKMMDEMKRGVLKSMQELEDCIGEMEKECERVFRSLISARVSLLNILTHA